MNRSNDTQFDNKTWISSKDLLIKTNISRGTLNNYIRDGIVPRPLVKRPVNLEEKAKKIGYFPLTVLYSIERIKKLKKEGHSMEEIIKDFKKVNIFENVATEEIGNVLFMQDNKQETAAKNSGQVVKELGLRVEDINAPAFFLNYKFEIEWINSAAEEKIFNQSVRSKKTADSRNIFKLFFSWEFHNCLTNWEKFVDFYVSFFKMNNSKESLEQLYSDISAKEFDFLKTSYDRVDAVKKDIIRQEFFTIEKKDGIKDSYRIYTVFFREGMVFVYEPSDCPTTIIPYILSNRDKIIKKILQQRLPSFVPFCVLVADLQDSCRICAELLPEEYFRLIKQIYVTMEESFTKYYGVYGKHSGDGMVYYFLKEQDSSYLNNSINCAKEIKQKMEKLSAEWRVLKKWQNDLYLNIGVTEGEEFFGTIPSSNNIEFTALGDTVNFAARLSTLARYGSIMTTKNLIGKLKDEERATIRFGIKKKLPDREVFVENTFSRVMDFIPDDDLRRGKIIDIATLIITEVVE